MCDEKSRRKVKNESYRMSLLSQIKKLSNISKIQRDDVQVLRQERDRLQRKSFPMFDQAYDKRAAHNPDVIYERAIKTTESKRDTLKLPAIHK